MDKYRIKITKFLQWNDRNGCYTNENCDLEEVPRMTYEDTIRYFFGIMNDDFYDRTMDKLNKLINEDKPTVELYKSLI